MPLIRFTACALTLLLAGTAAARPLVTSSEENVAVVCLSQEAAPARIVAACDAALADAGLTKTQRVELLISRGDALVWQEDMTAAEAAYRAAAALDPSSTEAWNGLGWALRTTADDRAAFEAFETSLAADVSVQGLAGKASTGRAIGEVTGEEAREMLRAALTIDPDYTWALREIAWSHLDDSQPAEAATAFGEALEADESDLNARYGLGRALLSDGDGDRALETFNDVLSRDGMHLGSRVYRIITLRSLDRSAQALREADRVIEDFPDMTSGYIERGLSLLALERRSEAIATYERAEGVLGPNNSILYWYADALATDGQFGRALEVIDRALGLDGWDYSDLLLKSYIALEMEDYAMARQSAEASLSTGVEDPWAHYYVAISMVHSGETGEGLKRFDRAMEAGLPEDRVGAFAKELISAGKYVEAAQLRIKY